MNFYLKEAVERNVPTKSATESDLQEELVKFIHGASDREGGRLARKRQRNKLRGLPIHLLNQRMRSKLLT